MRRASDGLRRTASGGFGIADAVTLEALEAMDETARDRLLLAPSVLVAAPAGVARRPDVGRRFLQGRAIAAEGAVRGTHGGLRRPALLGVADVADGFAQPRRVVPAAPISVVQAA